MLIESELTALIAVIVIDLILAGDNAIVVGMAVAGLPPMLRRKAIIIGIAAAAFLRIVFAFFAIQLLTIIGLLLVGGLLLLWVVWKLWRDTRRAANHSAAPGIDVIDGHIDRRLDGRPLPALANGTAVSAPATKTFRAALTQIVVADVSMSLDNVLAVAGTARHHVWVLVIGLSLSVALMGLAATLIARLLNRYPWISYLGLILIAAVALTMIWEGGREVFDVARRDNVVSIDRPPVSFRPTGEIGHDITAA